MTFIHTVMHILTVFLSIILFTLSFAAYQKKKKVKLLFVSLAFFVFAIKEGILAYESLTQPDLMTLFGHEHILNFIILLLFAFGVLRK